MADSTSPQGRRGTYAVMLGAVAVSIAGYFTGTRGLPEIKGYSPPEGAEHQGAARAPKQADMAKARYEERGAMQRNALALMAKPPRGLEDQVAVSEEAYRTAVAAREAGRAYDGAPPTVPHPVEQQGAPACLACHAQGLSVEGRVAPVMSHVAFANCQQCHVTREGPGFGALALEPSLSESNRFVGLGSPGHGPRAWPVAPPQIPHRSFMREQCTSCHGVWAMGLASSHPSRESCRQCHTPSASSDQFPRSDFEPLGTLHDLALGR